MFDIEEAKMHVGERIHKIRKQKKLTLADVSERSGVALATLSRIENKKMTGTLEAHTAIAKALDMTLPELYYDMDKPIIQSAKEHIDYFVHDEKSSSVMLTKDILAKKMMPVLIRIGGGGRTHNEELKKGTEKFLYVLEGKIEAVISNSRAVMEPGTTLYFDASLPHYLQNPGTEEAQCICVVTPSSL